MQSLSIPERPKRSNILEGMSIEEIIQTFENTPLRDVNVRPMRPMDIEEYRRVLLRELQAFYDQLAECHKWYASLPPSTGEVSGLGEATLNLAFKDDNTSLIKNFNHLSYITDLTTMMENSNPSRHGHDRSWLHDTLDCNFIPSTERFVKWVKGGMDQHLAELNNKQS